MRWPAVLPLALSASAASAAFQPVPDRPYRYETVETRTVDGVARRFHASRTVVFQRSPEGFVATVTLDAVDQQAGDTVGQMFVVATGALLHRPLHFRLDTTGTIRDIPDADAAVTAIADAIERIGASNRARSTHSKVLASPLRTLSPERRVAMVRTILSPVIAGDIAERTPGQRKISVPSRPPLAPDRALAGLETISRGRDGVVTIAITAHGGIDAAVAADAPGARIATPTTNPVASYRWIRNIDAATGLLLDSREHSEATASDGEAMHITEIETVITLTLGAK